MREIWLALILMTAISGCQTAPHVVHLESRPAALAIHGTEPAARTPELTTRESDPAPLRLEDASHAVSRKPSESSVIQTSAIVLVEPEELSSPPRLALSLADAIEMSLERNPDLLTALESGPVSRSALDVASRYPYAPTAQAQLAPSPREADGTIAKTLAQVALTETIELGGQRQHRRQSGVAQLDRTEWLIQQAAVTAVAETQRRFFTALYQADLFDVQQSTAKLNEDLSGVLVRRFDAGQASAADVALANIEARTATQQAAVAKTKQVAALEDLRAQLGLDPDQQMEIRRDPDYLPWLPPQVRALVAEPSDPADDDPVANEHAVVFSRDPVQDSALDHNGISEAASTRPDVLAAEADLRGAEAQFNLAQANLVPDVQLGPYYERDEAGTEFWGVLAQAQIGTALTSSGNVLVRQRMAELQQRRSALEQMTRKARLEIAAAIQRYRQSRRVVEQFGDDEAKELSQQVDRVRDLYDGGQVDLVRVFEARKALFQYRISRAEAINELGQAAADLTLATGALPQAPVVSEDSNGGE